jgi:hypothetical protein
MQMVFPCPHPLASAITHRIQGVAAQLVVSLECHVNIKLHTSINGQILVLMRAIGLAAELRVPHLYSTAKQAWWHMDQMPQDALGSNAA